MGIVNVSHGKVRSRAQTGESLMALDSVPTQTRLFTTTDSSAQVDIPSPAPGTFWEITNYDEDVWVKFGTNPVADETSSILIPAGATVNFAVSSADEKIAIKNVTGYTENLNLNFQASRYILGSTQYTTPGLIPGWTFSRPGWNWLTRSQELTNTGAWINYWAGPSSRTTAAAPDGTMTAARLVLPINVSGQPRGIMQNPSQAISAGVVITGSVWLRGTVGGEQIFIAYDDSGFGVTATLTTSWQRYSVSGAVGGAIVRLIIRNNSTTLAYTIDAWGAQLEPGNVAGPYQVTTSAAVTSGTNTTYSEGLIDEVTTNLYARSQEFDNSWWAKANGSVTANATTAPDNTVTADLFVEDTTANVDHGISYLGPFNFGSGPYTASVYLKPFVNNWAYIWLDNGSGSGNTLEVNLLTGATRFTRQDSSNWTSASATTVNVGNGWWRVSISATTIQTYAQLRVYTSPTGGWGSGNFGTPIYTGGGVNGFYVWGAQLERRSTVGNYIPTTSSAASGLAGGKVQGLVTFGPNQPRITDRGLLIEEARTNLLLRSQEFDNAAWIKTGATVTADNAVAPDGSTTADSLVETSATTVRQVTQLVANSTATTYTFSTYIKAATRGWAVIQLKNSDNSVDAYYWVNLTTGAVGTTVGSPTITTTVMANGWVRCTLSRAFNASQLSANIYAAPSDGTLSYAGNSSAAIFIWQTDIQAGSFPTSPILTTTAAATRAADNASVTGLSAMLGQFRTNLLTQSTFPGTPGGTGTYPTGWVQNGANPAVSQLVSDIGPGFSTNIVRIRRISTTGYEGIANNPVPSIATNTIYAFSVYVRIPTGVSAAPLVVYSGSATLVFISAATLNALPKDTWVRQTATFSATTTPTLFAISADNGAVGTGFDLANPQLELGSTATDYISTASSAVTVGNPVTLVAWADLPGADGVNRFVAQLSDGTAANRVIARRNSFNAAQLQTVTAGVPAPESVNTLGQTGARLQKYGIRVRSGEYLGVLAGAPGSTVAVSAPAAMTTLSIGSTFEAQYLNGYVQRVQILGDTTDGQLVLQTL